MLCDSEKMGMLLSNEWTQRMMMGDDRFLMPNNNNNNNNTTTTSTSNCTSPSPSPSPSPSNNNILSSNTSSSSSRAMVQHDQHALKCPRCDSSNTKFCYYNNYSLSQPRHFCKACKRYWTRGGTLRNVPIGGGCRKNKRVKKPSTSGAAIPRSDPPPPHLIPPLSLPSTSQISASVRRSDLNSFFYGLPSTSSDMNLAAFTALRPISCTAYDLQPQLNALGLGFSSTQRDAEQYQSSRFGTNLTDLQQSAAFLNDYSNFGSHLSAASLLVSTLKQPKKMEDYQSLLPYDDLQASANGNLGLLKEVKVEGEINVMGSNMGMDWQVPCDQIINPFEAINAAASVGDSSYLYWNPAVGGAAWPDGANSSVAPLI